MKEVIYLSGYPKCAEKQNKKDIINNKFENVPPSECNQLDQVYPKSLFELFFDDKVVNFMVYMTNFYAQRDKGKHNFTPDLNEMHLFLAMLLLTGYNQLPRKKMYWENSSNVLNTAMSNAISRNCFEELLSVSHLSNNMKLDTSDKLAKVRSFYNLIVCPCVEFRK